MRVYQTLEQLTETVYPIDISDSNDTIDSAINIFLKEVLSRKRNSLLEDGLQACGIIEHERAGFKVNEKDGETYHVQNYEIIAQYLNGDTLFTEEETIINTLIRKDDPYSYMRIEMNEIPIRIVASKDKLLIHFATFNNNLSLFQLNIMDRIIKYTKLLYEQGIISDVLINYLINKYRFIRTPSISTQEQFTIIEDYIRQQKEEINAIKETK